MMKTNTTSVVGTPSECLSYDSAGFELARRRYAGDLVPYFREKAEEAREKGEPVPPARLVDLRPSDVAYVKRVTGRAWTDESAEATFRGIRRYESTIGRRGA
jgi:hypothetical protein